MKTNKSGGNMIDATIATIATPMLVISLELNSFI